MAISVATFNWTSVEVTPSPVETSGSVAIRAEVTVVTHIYDYDMAAVCGNTFARAVSGDRLLQVPKYLCEQ